jgi:hypothetical protein
MANREVNLTKRVQTPHGWRYCRVLLSTNGRVKPDVVNKLTLNPFRFQASMEALA